jgi:hypothetical protein
MNLTVGFNSRKVKKEVVEEATIESYNNSVVADATETNAYSTVG